LVCQRNMHDVGFSKLNGKPEVRCKLKRTVVISAGCNVHRNVQGATMSWWGRCRIPCGGSGKWHHYKLPEQQPDGVNKGPEIVVTINFGAGVEANISEYLSEFLANRRHIIKHDTDMLMK